MENYQISKKEINKLLDKYLVKTSPNHKLTEAISLLFQGGKRLRPIISQEIAKAVNKNNQTNFNLDKMIVISEIIHSTSLIVDDLPCMDNDITRRGNPTIHYKYGETSAHVLTSYLFSQVFSLLHDNLEHLKLANLKEIEKREEIIFTCLSDNLGIVGAPLGQYLDNCDCNPFTGDKEKIKNFLTELLEKKTATFFEIAFVIGYIGSGGEMDKLEDLKFCAKLFGIAFQISDDFQDTGKDAEKSFCPNFVNHLGREEAVLTFNSCLQLFREKIIKLGLYNEVFQEIITLLRDRV